MSIAIILRKKHNINRFRDLMIGVIKSGCGDSALLCSGFFQELKPLRGGGVDPYQVSQQEQFAQEIAQSKMEFITVGIHNNTWKTPYQNFRDSMVNAGVNLTAYYKSGLRWHAKVFILSRESSSIFGIIGSSNMTKNAFGVEKQFNHECDVVLWMDKEKKIDPIVESFFEQQNIASGEVIRGIYDNDRNNGLTIEQRLNNLKNEILESDLRELD